MKYIIVYTLPGERGKEHTASYSSSEAREKKKKEVLAKGGKIKSYVSHS